MNKDKNPFAWMTLTFERANQLSMLRPPVTPI